jgi:hypothetical protein
LLQGTNQDYKTYGACSVQVPLRTAYYPLARHGHTTARTGYFTVGRRVLYTLVDPVSLYYTHLVKTLSFDEKQNREKFHQKSHLLEVPPTLTPPTPRSTRNAPLLHGQAVEGAGATPRRPA